ncbi:MAG: hypothetical protein H6726_14385 [Sandaracinaceae bacterium]|nr:hypothetical protein [Sandaracinaceae bacterium]
MRRARGALVAACAQLAWAEINCYASRVPRSLLTSLRAHLTSRRNLLAACAILGSVLVVCDQRGVRAADSVPSALAAALSAEGLELDPSSIIWIDDPAAPTTPRSALFIAASARGDSEVYHARVRTGESAVLGVYALSNLTRTAGADEFALTRVDEQSAVYLSRVLDGVDALTLVDLRGEPAALTAGWSARTRAQNGITNLQETGRVAGFGRTRVSFASSLPDASLTVAPGRVDVTAPDVSVSMQRADGAWRAVSGAEHVEVRPAEKGEPGTITWVVDSVRNLSFVGPEPIAWLEHRVFGVRDVLQRAWYRVAGASAAESEAEAAADLALEPQSARRAELSVTDPELGWPPAPLTPRVEGRATGEGEWNPIVDDPFVRSYPNAPPAFYSTHLRVDPERPYTRVYMVVWDPRQVQLRVMTGTREPESATGETGPGLVPRDDETMRRVVAGFNGGFQSLHGEFAMMSEGRVYLPPKPFAATVAVYRDGRTSMGSWRDPPEGVTTFEEEWALSQIPADVVEMRQNLTSVVEGTDVNPWRRWWWGAAPSNDGQQVFIHRSGMCLTSEGFMVYFWGKAMSSEALAEAMLAARCVRGLHLDMNDRHTAFELYNVQPATEPFADLGRPIDRELEFEMSVPDTGNGYHMRGRKLVRSMTPMRFPRYIQRDPRDFFYLTLRPTLPGPDVPLGEGHAEGEGVFDTSGLPHAGWPHAFARAYLGPEPGHRTWLVRIDPRRAPPRALAPEGQTRALAYLTDASAQRGPLALYATQGFVGRRYAIGSAPEDAVVVLRGRALRDVPTAEAAIAVDEDGFLVYAERQAGDTQSLLQRLTEAGLEGAMALEGTVRLAFVVGAQTVAPDAFERSVAPDAALAFIADERPETEVLFPETRPRPYMEWGRIQDTRVRYRYEAGRTRRFSRVGGEQ